MTSKPIRYAGATAARTAGAPHQNRGGCACRSSCAGDSAPDSTRRRFIALTAALPAAVRASQARPPAPAGGDSRELLVFHREFTWTEDRPFFCWSPFAPGLNRPGLRGVKTGVDEPVYEPFDTGRASYPDNWIEPHDYWNGSWYFRYRFKTRPSARPAAIHIGIWSEMADRWRSWKEMTAPKVPFDGESGAFLGKPDESPARAWWRLKKDEPVDFARVRDFTFLGFVMWTSNGKVLHPAVRNEKGGWNDGREDYYPCVLEATIVAVPRGLTFSGWEHYLTRVAAPVSPVLFSSAGTQAAEPGMFVRRS